MTSPYVLAQILNRSELQLLDRAFGAAEFQGDLANTALIDETPADHVALIVGKPID
jgi:hypothetical protein